MFAPFIRCEATLRLAPEYQYLDNASLGEAEPCRSEPIHSTPQAELVDRFWSLFNRPGMIADGVDDLRDLLVFARGVCFAMAPPGGHACKQELEFSELVHKRFNEPKPGNWSTILLRALGDRPYLEALDEIVQLLREWQALRAKS